jgi:uncharacterized membrane protein YjjB (DUF3815 family)
MKLLPMLASFIGGYVGWAIGKPLGVFVATLASLIIGALAFYYARKYQKEMLG